VARYKFESAHDWLHHAYYSGDIGPSDLLALVDLYVEDDMIQDHFQNEMERDDYFSTLLALPCDSCGKELFEKDAVRCHYCRKPVHEKCTIADGEDIVVCMTCFSERS
jgi:hypothetical protein